MSSQSITTKSLGILPFRFHNEKETNNASLSEGLADSLAMRLYKVEGLDVRPPSSVRKFASESNDSFTIGKLLQVDYLLEGYIFPAKQRTRFTVQLLNIPDRSVLWAAQFDEKEAEIFKLEDRISERIADAILPYLELRESEPITDSIPAQSTDEIPPEATPVENELAPPPARSVKDAAGYRSAWFALIALITVFGGYLLWHFASPERQPEKPAPTILVMPLQNVGTRPADNSIGTGLAESLTGSLGNVQKLFVLSANAGRGAARMGITTEQIGREFNVDYILQGTLRRIAENGNLQTSAELVETKSGKILWTKTIVASDESVGELQSQIVESVLENLSIDITSDERQKIFKRQTNNGLAYEFYLVGRYHMASRSHDGLHRAIGAFNQALEKDSNFALAYVGLADAYGLENIYEIPAPPDAWQKAKENVSRALEFDENLAEAHAAKGYILANNERKYEEAAREFRRAIELNPSYATTHHWFAISLAMTGKHQEALSEIQLAQKLDPQSAIIQTAKGMIHFYARQYREAIAACEKSVAFDPGMVPAYKAMRWIHQASNNYAGALAAYQKEKSFSGSLDAPGWLVIEAQVEAIGDNKEKARAILEKGITSDFVKENPVTFAYEIALAYLALDEREKALEWLEKAEAVNNHSINFINVDPRLEKLRDTQRFKAIAGKV
jgi:adenylate cyclase